MLRIIGFGMLLMLMTGCAIAPLIDRVKHSILPGEQPVMGWDAAPDAAGWTTASLAAVARYDSVLAGAVPKDIAAWCPAYADRGLADRRAFWAGLLSAVAKLESSWNPRAAGGGGRYIGLLQIAPKTAAAAGCTATSAAALKEGSANLACGVQIMARSLGRDKVIAGNGRQGLGRDWGPFNQSDQRAALAASTRQQPYCQQPIK